METSADSMIVAFDEGHGESWTIEKSEALRRNPLKPEYHYYGHLSHIIGSNPFCKVVRLTESLEKDYLRGIRALIVAHPASELNLGSKASSYDTSFSKEEVKNIEEFVREGGGLFVVGEHSAGEWGDNLSEMLSFSGISLNNDTLKSIKDDVDSHILVQHFSCSDIVEHPLTAGISEITFHRGCSLSVKGDARGLIRAPNGEWVMAVQEVGKGRVAVIGDSDLFSIPYIGARNNALLFVQTIYWLSGLKSYPPSKIVEGILLDLKIDFNISPYNRDLKKVDGKHKLFLEKSIDEIEYYELLNQAGDPFSDIERFLQFAELMFQELPRTVRQQINHFRKHGNEYGCLLISGVPIDNPLPPTPPDSRRSKEKKTFVSEFWSAVFGSGLGDPIGYTQEKDGEIFQNICPVQKNADALSSESSTILLDFHTETAFHPHLPEFLLLLCLRSDRDKQAKTEASTTRGMIPLIPLKYRFKLFEPSFITGIDHSFGSISGKQGNGPRLPVFYGNPYDPFMKFDLDLMVGDDETAVQALQQMRVATNAAKNYVKLERGDLLIIDNRRSVHSRTMFKAYYDGKDRWLQRMFVLRDVAATEEERLTSNRIINTDFRL